MGVITAFFQNVAAMSAIAGWLLAQILKVVFVLIEDRKFDFTRFFGAGGMPSSHSAFVSALATAVGLCEGFNSPAFAISFVLMFIVMYDASGVRRAAGEQAKIINKIVQNLQHGDQPQLLEKNLKELLGHTPFQVIVGFLLGIVVALVMYYYVYGL